MLSVSCRSICFSTFFFFLIPSLSFTFWETKSLYRAQARLVPKSWFPFHWSHTSPALPAALSACDRMTCVIYQRGQAGPWEMHPTKPERVHFAVLSYPLEAPCQESLWCFCLHSITVRPSTFTELTLPTSAHSSCHGLDGGASETPSGDCPAWEHPPPRVPGSVCSTECSLSHIKCPLPSSPHFSAGFKDFSPKCSSVRQGQRQKEQW